MAALFAATTVGWICYASGIATGIALVYWKQGRFKRLLNVPMLRAHPKALPAHGEVLRG